MELNVSKVIFKFVQHKDIAFPVKGSFKKSRLTVIFIRIIPTIYISPVDSVSITQILKNRTICLTLACKELIN